jgi:hypothetical protein
MRKLCAEDRHIVAWWGTPVECCSAFARLRRDRALTPPQEQQARQVLSALTQTWTEIEPSRTVREKAERALLLHPLRSADSLQLASALVWAQGHAAGKTFVCTDRRLRDAAGREGFLVLPPEPS